MLCPLRIRSAKPGWIAKHPEDFECVSDCAWLMMKEAHDKIFGVCAATFLAAHVQKNLSTICNFEDVTEDKQSPGTDKSTG